MSPRITPENRIPDIVTAAIKVFGQKGYRLARMEEIAKQADVSKATLYYYFKSKLHLFQFVLENGAHERPTSLTPPPEGLLPRTESEFLRLLKKKLRRTTRLASVHNFLAKRPGKIDIEEELAGIIEELWDISERNRMRIIILEKSFFEFPELAEVYARFGRGQMLRQLEEYLKDRIRSGKVRPVHSVRATARFMLESVAWFGFKQWGSPRETYPKSEALPELISIFVNGLKKRE